jgi:hypothetical protein
MKTIEYVIDPGTHMMPAPNCWSVNAEMPPGRDGSSAYA